MLWEGKVVDARDRDSVRKPRWSRKAEEGCFCCYYLS